MWSQEKSQKTDDQDVNSCGAILSQVIGNIIFRCLKQNTRCGSLISEIHSLLHYTEWHKVNKILKTFVVLLGKIAKRSWREPAFVTRSEWQQRSWENKYFSRITRLHWNIFQQIHSYTTIIEWYNALVSFKQLLVSAGKIAKDNSLELVLDSKIRVAIGTPLQVRSVWYSAVFT
jgi:hypothetical protein